MSQTPEHSSEQAQTPAEIIQNIPGTHDRTGERLEIRKELEDLLREKFRSRGAQELETPILERESTFVLKGDDFEDEKFGVEVHDITKEDQGSFESIGPDRSSADWEYADSQSSVLRAEGTAPAARYVAGQIQEGKEPKERFFYMGPMFRNEDVEDLSGTKLREFRQAAIEYFGPDSPGADAEVIDLSVSILNDLGLEAEARVSDMRFFEGIVDEVYLSSSEGEKEDIRRELDDIIDDISGQRAKQNPEKLEEAQEALKVFNDRYNVNSDARDLLHQASGVMGEFDEVEDELESLVRNETSQEGLDAMRTITDYLDALDTDHSVDTGVVRGLGFYTGTVFQTDVYLDDGEVLGEVAGGGRYDDLVGDFLEGSDLERVEVPATGFGWGLERIVEALADQGYVSENSQATDVVVYSDDGIQAMSYANDLREEDLNVQVYHGDDFDEAQQIAENKEANFEVV